jgi:hypothetical protein
MPSSLGVLASGYRFTLASKFWDFYDWADVAGTNWPSRKGKLPALTGVTKSATGVTLAAVQTVALPALTIAGAIAVSDIRNTSDGYNVKLVRLTQANGWDQEIVLGWDAGYYTCHVTTANMAQMDQPSHRVLAGEVAMGVAGHTATETKNVAFPNTAGEVIATGGWSGTTTATTMTVRTDNGFGGNGRAGLRFVGVLPFSPIHSSEWTKIRDGVIAAYGVTMRP